MDRPRKSWRNRIYFRDPKVPIFAVIALLGCVFLIGFFSGLLQFLMLGPNPSYEQIYAYNRAVGGGLLFIPPLTVVALLFLLIYGIDAAIRRGKRKPLSCPRCGMVDGSSNTVRLVQEVVEGTDWKTIKCPQCGHDWHERR